MAHGRLDEVGEPRIWRQVRGFFVPGRLLDLAARFGQNDARRSKSIKSYKFRRTDTTTCFLQNSTFPTSSLNKKLRDTPLALDPARFGFSKRAENFC